VSGDFARIAGAEPTNLADFIAAVIASRDEAKPSRPDGRALAALLAWGAFVGPGQSRGVDFDQIVTKMVAVQRAGVPDRKPGPDLDRADPGRDRRVFARSPLRPGPGDAPGRSRYAPRSSGGFVVMRFLDLDPMRVARLAVRGPVAALALLTLSGCQRPVAKVDPPAPTVGVVESRRMSVPIEVTPNGTTRALESVTIRARVRGFLTERHFAEGAMVKKGQLLLVIDEEPYQVALQSARARQADAEASLRKAEESKGREVSAAQLDLDRAQLLLAQIMERRNRALVARNAGSAEDLDRSEADRRRWESQVEADRAHLDQAKTD
jgi:hypothetical protein